MPLPPEPLASPSHAHDHETLIQYNLRNKVCANCKKPGARLKCEGCRQRRYCDKDCQKKDWKEEHRKQCAKLQQVFSPPSPRGGGAAGVAAAACGGDTAAASVGPENPQGGGEVEVENPCPICLDNADDANVNGTNYGMCFACGQMYCGACKGANLGSTCPTCRAPLTQSDKEQFRRCKKLVHNRSPGRFTLLAQINLASMYKLGCGVKQNLAEALKLFKMASVETALSAASVGKDGFGTACAQIEIGLAYQTGAHWGPGPDSIKVDIHESLKWFKKAATNARPCPPAQELLGYLYDPRSSVSGIGVPQDIAESAKWHRLAAQNGIRESQSWLAVYHAAGEGVPTDLTEAVKWFQLAAEQGCKKSLQSLNWIQDVSDLFLGDDTDVAPPQPKARVVTTLLSTSMHNGRVGVVVRGGATRQGRVAVLLEGDSKPKSFKWMNIREGPISAPTYLGTFGRVWLK